MTDKPLKTKRLRRLNKTQSNKQEESQTKPVKKTLGKKRRDHDQEEEAENRRGKIKLRR